MHPVIPRVPDLAINRVKIAGPLRMARARELWLPVEQGAAVVGREQPLVWVDDEAVGALDPVEEVTHARGSERRTAVRPVDVHPDPNRSQTSAIPAKSSTMPAFVVPAEATTANTSCELISAIEGPRRELTVIVFRHDHHFGVKHGGSSMYRRMGLRRARQPPLAYRMPPRWFRANCRAATRAERLPVVPPDMKQPPAVLGQPSSSTSQASAWFSAKSHRLRTPRYRRRCCNCSPRRQAKAARVGAAGI